MKWPSWLLVGAGVLVLLVLAGTRLAPVAYVILGVAVIAWLVRIGNPKAT